MLNRIMAATIAATVTLGISTTSYATENGGGAYPNGAEGYLNGALPPAGTYFLNYLNHTTADRFNDGDGDEMVPDFKVDASAEVVRIVHVTNLKILGADYAAHVIVPFVHVSAQAGATKDFDTGIGDITIDPIILGWHSGKMNYIFGVDVILPTGGYNRNKLANVGRNYTTVEPLLAVTYVDPKGLELSGKFMYDFNTTNKRAAITPFNPTGSDYKSGQEFHVDLSAGWNFSEKFQLGVSGYYYRQMTKDRLSDPAADAVFQAQYNGFKGEAFAMGPAIRLKTHGIQAIAAWQHEFVADYRPQGDKIWLKTVMAF